MTLGAANRARQATIALLWAKSRQTRQSTSAMLGTTVSEARVAQSPPTKSLAHAALQVASVSKERQPLAPALLASMVLTKEPVQA